MDKTWGIKSEYQNIRQFFTKKENLKVLEIGPGKGLLLDKIIDIYGKDNFYAMQPKNNEYSECNNMLKEKLKDKFIEFSLEEYVKKENFIKFDIIYIFKININYKVKKEFVKSLSEILNKDGIIYITSVEKERFHVKDKNYYVLWLKDELEKYFKLEKYITNVGLYYYGECYITKK